MCSLYTPELISLQRHLGQISEKADYELFLNGISPESQIYKA
jgi:hypothetical protein